MNRRLKFLVNSPLWKLLLERALLPPLMAAMRRHRPANILEIGCGQGDTTALLLQNFPEADITAVDYDAEQIGLARRRITSGRTAFLRADATRLPFADASFAAAVEFNTLHHVAPWRQALSEAARVLRPGGFFAVMDETASFFNPFFRWFDRPEALFSKEELILTAAETGLIPAHDVGGRSVLKIVFIKK